MRLVNVVGKVMCVIMLIFIYCLLFIEFLEFDYDVKYFVISGYIDY